MKLLLVTDNLQPYSIKTDKQNQRKKVTQYICNAIITTCSTNNIGLVADQIPTEFSYQITWYKVVGDDKYFGADGQKISQFCCLPKFGWLDSLIAPYIWWNSHDTNIYLIHALVFNKHEKNRYQYNNLQYISKENCTVQIPISYYYYFNIYACIPIL